MEPLERLLNLVGLLLETRMPLTFEQIRETLEPYRPGERGQRQADVRAGQGHPARLRRAAGAGRHRRVGDRAGLRHPEGRVLPPGDRVHAGGAGRAVRCRAGRPQGHAGRGSRAEADRTAPRGAARRAGGRAARVGLGRPRRPRHGRGRGRAGTSPASASATGPRKGTVSDRDVDAYAALFRSAAIGTWSASTGNAARFASFRLSRFTTDLDDAGEGSEPPDGFRAADLVQAGPWTAAGEERATIALSPGHRVVGRRAP